jgi:hypothetical protein
MVGSALMQVTGLRNLPCRGYAQNKVWLELALTARDLLSWTQALCLSGELARCEPAALRYRVLHVAAHLVRTGRQSRLKIDKDWPWAAPWPAGARSRPDPDNQGPRNPHPARPPDLPNAPNPTDTTTRSTTPTYAPTGARREDLG